MNQPDTVWGWGIRVVQSLIYACSAEKCEWSLASKV